MEFNLADLFECVADAVPDRECVVCGDQRLTYREVDERSTRLAHTLAGQGVGPGDHVALVLANGPEYLEAMMAAFKLRAVPINVNYRYVEDELHYLLDDADARAAVVHHEFAPRLARVLPRLPRLTTVVTVDDGAPLDPAWSGRLPDPFPYEDAMAAGSPERDFPPRSGDDIYILYTGGTTGMPKGVMWRHEDIFFGALGGGNPGNEPIERPEQIRDTAPRGRQRSLPASPFMHGTAHWMALAAMYAGGTVVVSPDRHFDPDRMWELISRERVSFLTVVGDAFARPLVDALARLPEGVDPTCCRVILSGGAILSPSVKEALAAHLPGTLVVDGYGSSETGGHGQGITTAGAPASGPRFQVTPETCVLDDHLEPITEPGIVGRLARRGRIPLGYYKDPEKTVATFPEKDGVRWAVPGDFAVLEDDGTVALLGRGSVSINTGGEKVYPEEVEAALKAHPSVFDAVVVGVADERWGERVVAVVQPRPGATPALDELDPFLRRHLAGYKVPRALVLVESMRRAASGKPDYRWARDAAHDAAREGAA